MFSLIFKHICAILTVWKAVINLNNRHLDSNSDIRLLKNVECFDHLHFNMEICIVLNGKLKVKRENDEFCLTGGMCVIIMPYEIHSYKSLGKTETIIIECNSMLAGELSNRSGFENTGFKLSEATLCFIKSKYLEKKSSDIFIKSIIYPVISDFFESPDKKEALQIHSEIYRKAIDYIAKNYSESINLKTAAEEIGCSYVYLSRIFSKTTKISFTAYLNRYRIIKSLTELKGTDKTVTEIAYSCGFETLRSYNREFKKCLNTTPKEYRLFGYKHYFES